MKKYSFSYDSMVVEIVTYVIIFVNRLLYKVEVFIDNSGWPRYHLLFCLNIKEVQKVKYSTAAMSKMAGELKKQHQDLKMSTFLSLLVCSDIVSRYLDSERNEKQITGAGFNVLNTLILCKGSAFPTDISRQLFRSKHSISKVIFTLEKHGLGTVRTLGEDRRKREVRITKKGIETTRRGSIYARKRVGEQILQVLTDEETKLLNDILLRLRTHAMDLSSR